MLDLIFYNLHKFPSVMNAPGAFCILILISVSVDLWKARVQQMYIC